jgi:hypothetical protein
LSCADLGFFLKGKMLSNNSVVLLSDIGEGIDGLLCLTNRALCCGTNTGGADRGIWKNPSGVNVKNTTADIYFTRGFSSLILNRRSNATVAEPIGVYMCFIPDANDNSSTTRTLTIRVREGN